MLEIKTASQESQSSNFKRYIGISPVTVEAINPTEQELKELLNGDVKVSDYISKDANGKDQIRIDLWVKTDPNWGNNIDAFSKITFFCSNQPVTNKDMTKIQVIDNYGESTWVTKEEFQAGVKPEFAQKVILPYRAAKQGEVLLTMFIKNLLGENTVPDSTRYDSSINRFVPKDEAERKNAEFKLDWDDICSGKCSQIKEWIKQIHDLGNEHKIKVAFGIRQNDGKDYQTIYNKMCCRNSTYNCNIIMKDIKKAQEAGMMTNQIFSEDTLKEYTPEKTEILNPQHTSPVVTPTSTFNDADLPF